MAENWKDINGYENSYQVSDLGNVRSVNRVCNGRHLNGKLMKPVMDEDGYLKVHLSKNGKATYYFVHRIVAENFIENPNGLKEINHKDENKTNNRVDNLEWCSTKYNINYGHRNKKVSKALSGENAASHKLTKDQVDEIRRLYSENKIEYNTLFLSNKYRISRRQINKIVTGNQWKYD